MPSKQQQEAQLAKLLAQQKDLAGEQAEIEEAENLGKLKLTKEDIEKIKSAYLGVKEKYKSFSINELEKAAEEMTYLASTLEDSGEYGEATIVNKLIGILKGRVEELKRDPELQEKIKKEKEEQDAKINNKKAEADKKEEEMIEAIRQAILASGIHMSDEEFEVLGKEEKKEVVRNIVKEKIKLKEESDKIQDEVEALNNSIKEKVEAIKKAKTKKEEGPLQKEITDLTSKKLDLEKRYEEIDGKLAEGRKILLENKFIGYDNIPYEKPTKEQEKQDKLKELYNDAKYREQRRNLFEEKKALEEKEAAYLKQKTALAERYKAFVDENGEIIKDPKDMNQEEKEVLAKYMEDIVNLKKLSKELTAERGVFDQKQNELFDEIRSVKNRDGAIKLSNARNAYIESYTNHYKNMGAMKKWGINALKRLGLARGEVGMPSRIKDLQKAYYEQVDNVIQKAEARLIKEGNYNEKERARVIEKYKQRFYNIEQIKAENAKLNQMRIDAFESDKKSLIRKMGSWYTGKSKGAVLARIALGAGVGAATGGTLGVARYAVRFGAGMLAGLGLNVGLNKIWKEEENAQKRIIDLEKRQKAGLVSISEFDLEYRKIMQKMNASKAVKKTIVTGGAFGAAYGTAGVFDNIAQDYTPVEAPEDSPSDIREVDDGSTREPLGPEPIPDQNEIITIEVDKGHGAISMFRELQEELDDKFPKDASGNYPEGTPASAIHILETDAHDLAREYNMYNPEDVAESATVHVGATFEYDTSTGELVFKDPYYQDMTLEDGDINTTPGQYDGRFGDTGGQNYTDNMENTTQGEKLIDVEVKKVPTGIEVTPVGVDVQVDLGVVDQSSTGNIDNAGQTNTTPDQSSPESAFDNNFNSNFDFSQYDYLSSNTKLAIDDIIKDMNPSDQQDFVDVFINKTNTFFGNRLTKGENTAFQESGGWNLLESREIKASTFMEGVKNSDSPSVYDAIKNSSDYQNDKFWGIDYNPGENLTDYLLRALYESKAWENGGYKVAQ